MDPEISSNTCMTIVISQNSRTASGLDIAETWLGDTSSNISKDTSMKDSFRSLERSFVDQDILQPLSKKKNTRVDDIYCQVVIMKALKALSDAAQNCIDVIESSTDNQLEHYDSKHSYMVARDKLIRNLNMMVDLKNQRIPVDATVAKPLLEKVAKAMNTIAANVAKEFEGKNPTDEWEACFLSLVLILKDMHTKLWFRLGLQYY